MGIGQSCERGLLRNLKIYLFLEQENIISEAAKKWARGNGVTLGGGLLDGKVMGAFD